MASGWNLWVWLKCIGVVSVCCCKEVYIRDILIIIITFPYIIIIINSTCSSFYGSSIPIIILLYSFLKCFFVLYNRKPLTMFVCNLFLIKKIIF